MKTSDEIIRENLHRFRYEDGKLYWVDGWRKGKEVGADNGKGHLRAAVGGKSVFVHRINMGNAFSVIP